MTSTELAAVIRTTARLNVDSRPFLDAGCLFWACHLRDLGLVEELLAQGADVDAVCRDGWAPLHVAVGDGNVAMVQRLLDAGARTDIQAPREGWVPYDWALAYRKSGTWAYAPGNLAVATVLGVVGVMRGEMLTCNQEG
jgi:ankyrin repeat protein